MVLAGASFGQINRTVYNGDKAMKAKDYAKAADLYTVAIKENDSKNWYYVFYKKAYCHYSLSQFAPAEVYIKKALKVKKSDAQYNWLMGNSNWLYARIFSKQGDIEKSLNYLRTATKYINESLLYSTIAYEEIALKQYEKALVNLNLALQIDSTNAYAFSNRALLYIYQKKYDLARLDIDASKKLDAKNPYVFKHSAILYIELNQLDMACLELTIAEALDYASFVNESDANEVAELKEQYCK
jgi:tetratricopeptide (TPR) repeat protein